MYGKGLFLLMLTFLKCVISDYEATWESLDARPLPTWFDKSKIGIFIHWGVYSVNSKGGDWFWTNWKNGNITSYVKFMSENYKPGFTYQEFAPQFTAELFNATEWTELFKKSGARYVVLTSKHHEGYTLWPSSYSYSWNSVEVGPHRDLVGELADAIRRNTTLKFGVYYSLMEWFNPMYLADKENNLTTSVFADNKVFPEIKELVNKYKPEILWSDGEWECPSEWWKSKELLAWLYNESPVKDSVVVNDRWGSDTLCKHGGYLTCADRYNPDSLNDRKWENAMTIDLYSWGYRNAANIEDYITFKDLLYTLIRTVSYGGNILINVGPDRVGKIPPIFQERLLDLGKWLEVNGEAIYETTPWIYQEEESSNSSTFYTQKDGIVYVLVTEWPEDNVLTLKNIVSVFDIEFHEITILTFLGLDSKIKYEIGDDQVSINFPDKAKVKFDGAYVLKIETTTQYLYK